MERDGGGRKRAADPVGAASGRAYIATMADKPAPKADDSYSDEETARRRDATVKAMIGMKPRPHEPLTPKTKTRPASKGRVRKGRSQD